MSEANNFTRPVVICVSKLFYGATVVFSLMITRHSPKNKMYYFAYVLENRDDKSWYIGFTANLRQRIQEHKNKKSPFTSRKNNWELIYAELYIDKLDALGREKFLKSGSGRRFLKKQLTNYLIKNYQP